MEKNESTYKGSLCLEDCDTCPYTERPYNERGEIESFYCRLKVLSPNSFIILNTILKEEKYL